MNQLTQIEAVEHRPVSPLMSPDIAKAIVAVTAQIGTLGKDGDNKFAAFKYVSVDKFFDQVGRLMAKEGLFVLTNEISAKVERTEGVNSKTGEVKIGAWLVADYELFLCHSSGSVCGPIKRTIRVQATGPQAYGSAASYVEKYFLRSLFKVPTGEKDIDAEPHTELHPTPPPPPPAPKKMPFDWAEARKWFNEAPTEAELNLRYEKTVKAYPHVDRDELQKIAREAGERFWEKDIV